MMIPNNGKRAMKIFGSAGGTTRGLRGFSGGRPVRKVDHVPGAGTDSMKKVALRMFI